MRYLSTLVFILISIFFSNAVMAQILTNEDSLAAGLQKKDLNSTYISGYGESVIQYNLRSKLANANLTRNVLFIGHRFSNKVNFFSEWELEDAKIEGGEAGGELAIEQMFIKFDLNSNNYISAGLIIPRIGIINENHLPTTFNSNARPILESILIPSTWREIGACYYGNSKKVAGLNYSLGIFNGLNAASFSSGKGIRGGRFEGRDATMSNIAVTGSVLYYYQNFRIQASTYFGGSNGISKAEADSIKLKNGLFGTPVSLSEFNIQYTGNNLSVKLLGAALFIPDAFAINNVYKNNTPQQAYGTYAEVSYNIAPLFKINDLKQLNIFTRYEYINLNAKIASNGMDNKALEKMYLFAGLVYKPIRGVSIKFDYMFAQTGLPNEAIINPSNTPFYRNNSQLNLGLGYSF